MRRVFLLIAVVAAAALVNVGGHATGAAALSDVGYRDFSFSANGVLAPTGEKPQSKLWFNDGTWWGSLFNRSTEEYHIYRYDQAGHSWQDTGTLIDERNTSKADTLWDGTHLYVATAGATATNSTHGGRILRYSYNAATKSYSRDPGFPVTINSGGMEAIVLDKDTTGKLWVTYTQGNQVYVNRSLSNDQTWGTPFVLPVNGTSVSSDDISAVVAFDNQIGVMWSNQNDDAMYFATHNDGDPDNVWQGSRTAIQGPKYADDHISIRSLQADEVSGRIFVAIKTSLNDVTNPNPNAPLIFLLARDRDGNWTNHVFGRVGDDHTRPIVMIDHEHRDLYVLATARCCDGGTIYYKKTSLSNISFPEGAGTPLIQSSVDTHVNNVTSTKQNINSTTGLLVLASDDTNDVYLHNTIDLGSVDTTAPTVTNAEPANGAQDVTTTGNVSAAFSEAMNASTINGSNFTLARRGAAAPVAAQVRYDAANMATLDPDVDLDPGTTYDARISGGANGAKDLAGNPLATDKTWSFTTAAAVPPADTTPPETTIDSGPSGTVTSKDVQFTFSSDDTGASIECSLDGGAYAACTSPKSYTGLADGAHTFDVRAKDAVGNIDPTPASRSFTVDTADHVPPETVIDSGPSGTVDSASASFAFSSNEGNSSFECKLDAGSYASCTSPKVYTGLADGSHTFSVRATDPAGNIDDTPANRSWTVVPASRSILTNVDTSITQKSPTRNYGASTTVSADGDDPKGSSQDISALIKWDLSSLPSGSKISAASVTLNITDASAETYGVYQLKQPWAEGTATWNIYATSKPWQIAGARGTLDRATQTSGTVTPSAKGYQTFNLSPALVQSWLENPAGNQGILLDGEANADGFSFTSGESTTSSQRPQLNVTYTLP